jgi:hypothetical protein
MGGRIAGIREAGAISIDRKKAIVARDRLATRALEAPGGPAVVEPVRTR